MTVTRLRDLYGDLWCLTCQHSHIPNIPAVTFRCTGEDPVTAGCGFGAWDENLAGQHARDYPAHNVYGVHHDLVPLGPPRPAVDAHGILPDGWTSVAVDGDLTVLCGWTSTGAFWQYAPTEHIITACRDAIEHLIQEAPRG